MANAIAAALSVLLLGWAATIILAGVRMWGTQQGTTKEILALRNRDEMQQQSIDVLTAENEGLRTIVFAKKEETAYLKGQMDTILNVLMKDFHFHAKDTDS